MVNISIPAKFVTDYATPLSKSKEIAVEVDPSLRLLKGALSPSAHRVSYIVVAVSVDLIRSLRSLGCVAPCIPTPPGHTKFRFSPG